MKLINIVNKLEKQGYEIFYDYWYYWRVPYVKLENGGSFAIADIATVGGSQSLVENFIFTDVQDAISKAELNAYYRIDNRINSMQDYYYFKSSPFDRIRIK